MKAEVVVVGAGPAGLSAAINLARSRRSILVLDSNRPRNAATFHSHGFLSREGISPLELRAIGRSEFEAYPGNFFVRTLVSDIREVPGGFRVVSGADEYEARAVVIATGTREHLPNLPSIRAYYGTSIHSCIECDAFEYSDQPIALIGETDDLAERARLLSQWSRDLIVFTNAVAEVTPEAESNLAGHGVRVDRRAIADVSGDRDRMTGVSLADGETVPRVAAFVRPKYTPAIDFAADLGLERDGDGLVVVDADGRTSVAGVYAAGDATPPGPQQLIVAAGSGARVAAAVNRDLLAG